MTPLVEDVAGVVRADPEPNEAIGALLGQRSMAKANPCRPELPNFLETNGGVTLGRP